MSGLAVGAATASVAVAAAPSPPQRVSCNGLRFPLANLSRTPGAERGRDAAARALARFVRSPENGGEFPRHEWRSVVRTPTRRVFAVGALTDPAVVEIERHGRWSVQRAERGCELLVTRGSIEASSWRVDPAHPVSDGARRLMLLVSERTCASGRDARGRVDPPLVHTDPRTVVVTIFVRPLTGDQRCAKRVETPVPVSLPDTLRRRRLLDGATIPPRPPSTGRRQAG